MTRAVEGTAVAHSDGATVSLYMLNGIPLTEINKEHVGIANIQIDSYTVSTTTNATSSGTGGGASVTATENALIDTMQTLVAGQWYHVAAIYDAYTSGLILYVNGKLIKRGAFEGEMAGSQNDDPVHSSLLYMGGDAGARNPFIGYLDEVRISGIPRQPWEFNVNQVRSSVSPD